MDDKDRTEGSVSRRRMIKRIGAGGALAWSAPVLASMKTPAFAQASPLCRTTGALCEDLGPACANGGCQPGVVCGFCARLLDGSCLCWDVAECRIVAPAICATDSDCIRVPGGRCGPIDCPQCVGQRACYYPCFGPAPRRAPAPPKDENVIVVHAPG